MEGKYEEFKKQVLDSSDIVDVISGYISLRKKGRDYWACCPFHGEKTPSFSVSKEKQFFYCYGCHVGGDVFTFVQKMENCTFPEAVKLMATKANIPIPEYHRSKAEAKREEERQALLEINDLAGRFFSACLHKTEYGAKALEYLQNRGITNEIIDAFSLGVSLPSYGSLVMNLGKRGCRPDQLIKAGLARQRRGTTMDAFIGRVMIPIKDPRGKIIAFGGRVLDQGNPKYLNTGETDLFQKRETLFGMDVAIKEIRATRLAIVVEGYMDAISLHAAGVKNAVASLGTAFSREQAKLLLRLAPTVVFAYDSDEAGRRNAVRAVTIAKEVGLQVKVLNVPEVKDPDEYVRKYGQQAFTDLVKGAMDGVEFQLRYTLQKNNISDLAGKVQVVSNILPFLLECKTEIEVVSYVRLLAQLLVIDEDLIMGEYRKAAAAKGRKLQNQAPVGLSPQVANKNKATTALEQAEIKLLLLFMHFSSLVPVYSEQVQELGFTSPGRWAIYQALVATPGLSLEQLSSRLFETGDSQTKAELARMMTEDDIQRDGTGQLQERIATDCIRQMQRSSLERAYEEHRLLADEYARGNDSRFIDELQECNRIRGKIKELYGNE